MAKRGEFKVRYLIDTGILYNNSEVRVLNYEGRIIFGGMAWEMDDDILNLDLKHILSVYPSEPEQKGKVWIEVYDDVPAIKPYMCIRYDQERCKNCKCDKEECWAKRKITSHGVYEHQLPDTSFGIADIQWSPSTPSEVKDAFKPLTNSTN